MFVGTDRALYGYNKHNDNFDLLPIKAWIQGIYEDEYGILWVNTYGSGVYQYNRGTGEIQHLSSEQGKRNTLVNNYVNGLFEDSKKISGFVPKVVFQNTVVMGVSPTI
ncbi:hypothetical protein KUH03_07440 [Sphingobacterium sp. E70]|uniref:two-component regulator propeller domain-containing protein n=1 Tax=Sphingobacterium sp. E70 TaxID=2853439 RepID=UPI00211C4937|nr:two-component regulator propeller domain-containing protein [Sphingobacterium sp. E70]ULT26666.1 hypothetical protein KUH03_07440 [Sphingobacterium sp. E70]